MTNINSAFYNYDETVEKSKTSYSGLLGLAIGGHQIVNHPTRAGFVYVRLRDNLSEVVQAFNDKVSPVYDFPVLIQRKGNKWYVLGRDDLRYENWGTSAPYLPRHGDQHSLNRDGGGGGDVTWVYPDQFMPLLVYPSGTYGASNLLIAPYVLQKSDKFIYVGNTGTANIARYKPTTSNAIMGLVYLDRDTGNPGFLINSGTPFSGSITGTNAIVPYLPYPSATQEPLYAFRLVSGTSAITWDNLYNVRQFIGGSTSTGTSTDHESLTGLLGGSANNHYHLTPSQVTGLVSGTNTALHSHSGSSSSYNFVTGSIAFADTDGNLIEDNKHLRYNQVLRSIRMGKDFPFINYADLFPIFVTAENAGESLVYGSRSWGTGTSGQPFSGFAGYRSRGTIESPEAIQKGDLITSFFGQGYDGGDFWAASRIRTYADQDWVTNTYRGSRMEFFVVPSGTANLASKIQLYGDSLNLTNATYNINGTPLAAANVGAVPNDGWIATAWASLTRISNTVFTTTTDVTGVVQKGTKLKLTDTTTKYFVVVSAVFSAGVTTITTIATTDYVLAGNPSSIYYSPIESPFGWPSAFNYTPIVSSGTGSITTYSVNIAKWTAVGKEIKVSIDVTITTNGTGATYISITTPVNASVAAVGNGREYQAVGRMLQAAIGVGTAFYVLWNYDNSYPAADGYKLSSNISYVF